MMSISWLPLSQKWAIVDENGKTLWEANKYADAVQFIEDFANQHAIKNGLK